MELPFALETLLPLACAWAEEQELHALTIGVPLADAEARLASAVGVQSPELVRVLEVARIPMPQDTVLRLAAANAGLSLEHSSGMALRYGIFLRADQGSRLETLVHELAHTAQYERLGGFEGFFRQYFTECLTVGYWRSPLEREAIEAANSHVR